MKKLYLGIDGGGTKTDFLLCDSDLREIARVTKSGCNPNDIGIDKCLEILCDGISNVMQGNEDNEISLFAGLSGGATGDNQA
ncbi:MAG: hypothetical protein Q4F84_10805, partial [Fibrobacter sp.]|nr:hypothetical protein [Fibrobacter sp.]